MVRNDCGDAAVWTDYAASVESSIGSMIEGSSFSGLLTRVEIGHMLYELLIAPMQQ
jgi:hypothetical protein